MKEASILEGTKSHVLGLPKRKKNIHKFDENRGQKNKAPFNHMIELVRFP